MTSSVLSFQRDEKHAKFRDAKLDVVCEPCARLTHRLLLHVHLLLRRRAVDAEQLAAGAAQQGARDAATGTVKPGTMIIVSFQGTMQGISQAIGCISRILGPLVMR